MRTVVLISEFEARSLIETSAVNSAHLPSLRNVQGNPHMNRSAKKRKPSRWRQRVLSEGRHEAEVNGRGLAR